MNPNMATATPMVPRMMNDIVPPYASAMPMPAAPVPQTANLATPIAPDAPSIDPGQIVDNIPVKAPEQNTVVADNSAPPPQPSEQATPATPAPVAQPYQPMPTAQSEVPQPQPVAQAQRPAKNHTQWLVIGLAIIVAVGLAAAAYYSLNRT